MGKNLYTLESYYPMEIYLLHCILFNLICIFTLGTIMFIIEIYSSCAYLRIHSIIYLNIIFITNKSH